MRTEQLTERLTVPRAARYTTATPHETEQFTQLKQLTQAQKQTIEEQKSENFEISAKYWKVKSELTAKETALENLTATNRKQQEHIEEMERVLLQKRGSLAQSKFHSVYDTNRESSRDSERKPNYSEYNRALKNTSNDSHLYQITELRR